jgi:hypothetical protein
MLVNEPHHKRLDRLACFLEDELCSGFIPIELEGSGQGRDPDLANGSVRRDHEFARGILENDIEDTVVLLNLETTLRFLGDERLFQGFDGVVRMAAKLFLIQHEDKCSKRRGAMRRSFGDLEAI